VTDKKMRAVVVVVVWCVPFSKGGGGGAEVPNELNQGSV
tara:strand:- start:325 stop:441 length:117 start_codon:yes stop_codon:yes gene_type:complete